LSDVLVDTQALIWFAEGSSNLSEVAKSTMDDPSVRRLVSVASIWEMAIKLPLGKLKLQARTLQQFVDELIKRQFVICSVSLEDAMHVAELPQIAHKDPFDRLIAAQAIRMHLPIVSADRALDAYGIQRIW
jgi:PIN domain nuclease of toxin-antitoxin system